MTLAASAASVHTLLSRVTAEIRSSVATDTNQVLSLRLTLVLLILHGASSDFLAVPLRVLCGLMLVFPALVTHAVLWWLIVSALVLGNGWDWYAIDNHKYLIAYWALAVALSLSLGQLGDLRVIARVLIGLVFAFATAWKLIAGGYLDGSFLYYTFLTDTRLQRLSAVIAGWSVNDVAVIRDAIHLLGRTGVEGVALPVSAIPTLRVTTLALSWLGLVVEGSIAVLHLWPANRIHVLRHCALIGFIVFTYFLLPVFPFAFILSLMGFSQCREDDHKMKLGYLILLGWMHLTLIGWQPIVVPDA